MVAVFFFAILPHDFIHEFAHHQDTKDSFQTYDVVSHHHIHCEFLRILIAPYVSAHTAELPQAQINHIDFFTFPVLITPVTTIFFSSLRGPPEIGILSLS